jgi:peptidyl-prolyl cis-trans isomerase D
VNQFRKYAKYIVLTVLFGMLIISFGFWGVGDMLRMGRGAVEVAHVGGTHIPVYGWIGGTSVSVEEVRDRFNRQLEAIQRQTGQRPEPEAAIRFGLHMRALEETVQRAIIDHAIREFGLAVSDEQVREAIAAEPAFHGSTGKFDPAMFKARLGTMRISEAQLVNDMRRQIAANQLLSVVRAEGLAPKTLRDDIFRQEGERRVAETVYMPDAIVATVPKPGAEQLNTYYEANKSRFQIAEYRAFSYVLLTVDDVMAAVTVTADMVKQEYDARAAEFGSPEKRDIDQVMVTEGEDKAKAIVAAVAGGKTLEDAAKEVLGNENAVIKLGAVEKKELPPGALADGIFGAQPGVLPQPIQSALGWHVVRLNKVEAGKQVRFEEVKEKIENDLKAQAAPDLLIKLVTDFERSLSKTQSMKTSAQELNLKVQTIEGVDARGQDPGGKQVVIGPAAAELVQAAFATRESTESQLFDTPRGEFFVVRTDRVTPARVPALADVEAKVKEAWERDEQKRLATEKAKELVEKTVAGANLETEVKAIGLEVRVTKPVTRFEADQGNYLTQAAVSELFKLGAGKIATVRTSEGAVIVRLKDVQPVDLAKEKDGLERFGKQLDAMMANDLVQQLVGALRGKYGVSIRDEVFAQAFKLQSQQQ